MKMGTGIFWGILLILIGLGIVIRVVFNIDFPLMKFIIAFFFIFIGVKIIFGNFNVFDKRSGEKTTIFSESRIDGLDEKYKEYNVLFGSSVVDLRGIDLSESSKEIKINTVFGSTIVKVDNEIPLQIKADAAFASAELPNGNSSVFGTSYYNSETFRSDTNYLYIRADVVFGDLRIKSY